MVEKITKSMGEKESKNDSRNDIIATIKVDLDLIDFFARLITALQIIAATTTRTPFKKCPTISYCKRFDIKNAIIEIIIKGKNIIPSVENMLPTTPFLLYPTKVATLTAIIPGVHCPIA